MARSIFKFPYNSPEKSQNIVHNILVSNGYRQSIENNEVVWEKGSVWLTGKRCIKVEFGTNELIVSGWIDSGFSETQLSGFGGSYAKGKIIKVIEQIKLSIF